jgi:dienelactone hydrolase
LSSPRGRQRWAVVAYLLICVVGLIPLWSPARVTVLSAALAAELMGIGDPLTLTVPAPRVESTTYGDPPDRMDLYMPIGASSDAPVPAVVLELGVHPPPIDDPAVADIAIAISRLGVIVAVPDSTRLRNLEVDAREGAHLADAFVVVAARPEVDEERVGLAGFSAGASIALLAAADARISDEIRFVSAFGGYANAERLLVDVATRTTEQEGAVLDWAPDAGIRRDVLALAINALDDPDDDARLHAVLDPVVSADTRPTGPDDVVAATFTGDALQIYRLFSASNRPEAQLAVENLSTALREQLAGISPTTVAGLIESPVFILHGRPDTAIPVVHAALLAQALDGRVERLTLFGQFGHEQPGQGGVGIDDVPDIVALAGYLRAIVAATLD